ncbi:DUF1800 family protein [Pelagicoccus sp. SDUM812003]|uniref:DUF1800 family protein n=1 Tax=Pelagicoccus sp. SDUM812003 TaxID=3041267 RepID=UPI00280F1D5A|nr:DUF1800 family protein [Pelagicoccus sp. SDUM812003]MDQ8204797.1 DUF1800 family protein [Pelagicoccus sp. SDUM812003]
MSVTLAILRRFPSVAFLAVLSVGLATPPVLAQQSGVLREVWTNLSGSDIDHLLESPNYPSSPTIRDVLPGFSAPPNFADSYGTRLRAYLTPSVSGDYHFWIAGDDRCALYFGEEGTASSAELVAYVPGHTGASEWEKYQEQRSGPLPLIAGRTYYLEALHKEGSGGDRVSVHWERINGFERSPIPSAMLAPYEQAPDFDPERTLYLEAGDDREIYLPRESVQLDGSLFAKGLSSEEASIAWTQIEGSSVDIQDANTLAPTISSTSPGSVTLQLSVSANGETRTDQLTVTTHQALATGTGTFTQEIWLGIGGGQIEDLVDSNDYPTRPHLIRETDTLTGPRHWGDLYGVRTRGRITPPKTGDYTFYVMGDDATALFISSDRTEENVELVAFTPERTSENTWTQFPEQASAPIRLEKGKQYYLELLYVDKWGGDYHGAAWSIDGGPIQLLAGEFFISESIEQTDTPPFEDAGSFAVEAGPNQSLYLPDSETKLNGAAHRISQSPEIESVEWIQVSGPSAILSSPNSNETAVTLSTPGEYVFEFSGTMAEETARDRVTVSLNAPLSENTGKFTREVWLDLKGSSVDDLLTSPRYPDHPDIVDQLTSLTGPKNWEDRFGVRASGYLIPTRTGPYTFYLSADESATLKLSPDNSRENAVQIASSSRRNEGDYRDENQISDPIQLVANQRYYIEVLHKEEWGNDHFQVEWSFGEENAPTPVGGGQIEPFEPNRETFDPDLAEYAYAGRDRHYYLPTSQIELQGEILVVGERDYYHTAEWTYIGDIPGVELIDPKGVSAKANLPGAGSYSFRLTLRTESGIHYDDVSIIILPPLSEETGGLLRSVWLNVDGSSVSEMMMDGTLLDPPSFEDILPKSETPVDWTDAYATRLLGYIHPPASGDYQFWIAADDMAQLRISSSEDPEASVLVAELMRSVGHRQWDRYEEQASAPIPLEAGKRYFVEALQKESRYSDNLSIAWSGPGLNQREVITAGYLSPAYEAAPFPEHILVLAGNDQTLRWPENEIGLLARVYDHVEGPEALTYSWSSDRPGVEFAFPDAVSSSASFSGPGAYTLTLSVTDGQHTASDSLHVTVEQPISETAGSITREVWLETPGYRIGDLLEDPHFPDLPHIVDTLETFEIPVNWADDYGTRVRGYLIPPVSGSYVFYAAANDRARVSINTSSESFAGLEPIIDIQGHTSYRRWDQREDQASAPIQLVAGQAYPIELLHKEGSNEDYASLAWKRPGSSEIEIISGAYLAPSRHAPALQEGLIVIAPEDISQRWPQNIVDLHGIAFDTEFGPEAVTTRWEQESGPGEVTFSVAGSLDTDAHFSEAGVYQLRLYATDGENEAYDTFKVTIEEPLSSKAGAATRSIFTNISGDRVIDMVNSEAFPTEPESTGPINQLDTQTGESDHFGTLVTGYLHPPASGSYRFSITGDDWAELWLSSSDSPREKTLICFTPRSTDPYEWDKYPEYQTSAEIDLEAGKRYYLEIRHKEHNWRDHFSVAWLRPDEEEMSIIQGAYLSPTDESDLAIIPEIRLTGGLVTTLNVGEEYVDAGFKAIDNFGNDISDRVVVSNSVDTSKAGSYSVRFQVINPVTGFAETVVRTVNVVVPESLPATYPDPTTRPPMLVEWEEPESLSPQQAARFLEQASFGPTKAEIARVQDIGIEAWIDEQLSIPASLHAESMFAIKPVLDELGYDDYNSERLATWWTQAITGPDQLRQRVAFALSEIMVVSDGHSFTRDGRAVANYYDILVRNALGDYETLLKEVTLNPIMGMYLTMLRSDKSSPDENYAREVMQLFSIGLVMLNPDGSSLRDAYGREIPTYDQRVILELSRAFTGWTYAGSKNFHYTHHGETDLFSPMVAYDEHHDSGRKELMGGFILPEGLSPREDLMRAIAHIADHPNVGPFIARRLIQRLVTSNPSPAYIYRVASVFNDDGSGTRGNLGAVVKAILMDPEAREPDNHASGLFGKAREPIIKLTQLLRAFEAPSSGNSPVLGRYPIDSVSTAFGQSPLQAPSVFNFFDPDYAPPGEIMDQGHLAPEFGIITELTTVDTANFLHRVIDRGTPTWWRYSASIHPNLTTLIANARDSNLILDEIDLLLMAGSMSPETRSIIKTAIDTMEDPEERVESAIKLILSSPEYSIQK